MMAIPQIAPHLINPTAPLRIASPGVQYPGAIERIVFMHDSVAASQPGSPCLLYTAGLPGVVVSQAGDEVGNENVAALSPPPSRPTSATSINSSLMHSNLPQIMGDGAEQYRAISPAADSLNPPAALGPVHDMRIALQSGGAPATAEDWHAATHVLSQVAEQSIPLPHDYAQACLGCGALLPRYGENITPATATTLAGLLIRGIARDFNERDSAHAVHIFHDAIAAGKISNPAVIHSLMDHHFALIAAIADPERRVYLGLLLNRALLQGNLVVRSRAERFRPIMTWLLSDPELPTAARALLAHGTAELVDRGVIIPDERLMAAAAWSFLQR